MNNINTVLGPISPANLGATLVHEHLFVDSVKNTFLGPHGCDEPHLKALVDEKVSIDNLGFLRRDAFCCKDNLILDDEEMAIKEVRYFKDAEGSTIVDLTAKDLGRNPLALRRVSQRSGVNIITAAGFCGDLYTKDTHSNWVKKASIDELEEITIQDIISGINGTGIKAGVIGEIGVSPGGITEIEEKVLRSAARAQIETGVAMTVHTYEAWLPSEKRQTLIAIDILEDEGVDLSRVYMSHIDQTTDWEYAARVAETGVYLSLDNVGSFEWPHGFDSWRVVCPTDYERANGIKTLIERGFLKQILLSQDICQKINLRSYGGVGYAHTLLSMPKLLNFVGLNDSDIYTILNENPKNALAG